MALLAPRRARKARTQRSSGFTLVELVVALVILAFGILGLAGTTVYVIRQVQVAGLTTKRTAARQAAIEHMRALDFDAVTAGADTVGDYIVNWSVIRSQPNSKAVRLITTGPGYVSTGDDMPTLSRTAQDTFNYVLLRP